MSSHRTLVRQSAFGTVARVVGAEITITGLRLAVGDAVEITPATGRVHLGEVVAVDHDGVRALVFGEPEGLARGSVVRASAQALTTPTGDALLGRIVDGLGRPLDGLGPIHGARRPVSATPPRPLQRQRISRPLATGVRLIDTLLTVGRGQRLGLFAGSGVGKSTLLAMLVRGTDADRNVIALVGERGREVREFIEDVLGDEGLQRSVVVVATSDEPALLRVRAAMTATTIAEAFADVGHDVLLTVDSITRLATAQRDVGLAAGEPPTSRGYPPSAFAMLPRLLERTGPRQHGTITAFYTVLVEGDDHDEPVADTVRGILDGHLVLDRTLTTMGHFPAIDPLASISRLARTVTDETQQLAAQQVRRALAALERVRDLVELGAYVRGSDPLADAALEHRDVLRAFLQQPAEVTCDAERSWQQLIAIAQRLAGAHDGEVAA